MIGILSSACLHHIPLTWLEVTPNVGVSLVSRVTRAHGLVVDSPAVGVETALADAGIHATKVHAGLVKGIVGIDLALGSGKRISRESALQT